MKPQTKTIGGRILENVGALKQRVGIAESTIYRYIERGMPKPRFIGKYRWFDREQVDQWLLNNETSAAAGCENVSPDSRSLNRQTNSEPAEQAGRLKAIKTSQPTARRMNSCVRNQ